MNAIFSKTMQDTETKSFHFATNSNMLKKYLVHVLFIIEMLVFILQLKNFP